MRTKSVADLARAVNRHLKRDGGESPRISALTRLFESVYFASLKTEEGKPLQVRVALVDPANADPDPPPRPRADRWNITKLANQLPLTVPNLVKLSKAADPWSSCLAVYLDSSGELFVWGLVDQTVHFNVLLVREAGGGGYAPPGLFQVVAVGAADLLVYRRHGFVARLQQDELLTHQIDVFSVGPVRQRLQRGIKYHLRAITRQLSRMEVPDYLEPGELQDYADIWKKELSEDWISTLCRLLISVQRYRHGGALLITGASRDLDIKYEINYPRLPQALADLAAYKIAHMAVRDWLHDRYLEERKKFIPRTLYLDEAIAGSYIEDHEDEITGCVRFISSLSCVDGLVLASPNLAIRGFGVEIRTRKEVDSVYLSPSPRVSSRLRRIDSSHYGTRHRTMMRFCFAHPGSIGFVISQDGEIRAMTRVKDRLVMWENLRVLHYWEFRTKKQKTRTKTES